MSRRVMNHPRRPPLKRVAKRNEERPLGLYFKINKMITKDNDQIL
jgi:hypothetical protein